MRDAFSFFDKTFNHDEQVRLCARHLEVMRTDLGDFWWKLGAAAAHDDENAVALSPAWTSEKRSLAKHLIRHATESANHPTTVDFITKATLRHIENKLAASKRCTTGALKQWDLFTHEHMVPGAEVLRILTDSDYSLNRQPLAPLLGDMSWRALITGTKRKKEKGAPTFEVGQVEAGFADTLPAPREVPGWSGPSDLKGIPPKYYAFMRYDAAGLLENLIPVSTRAEKIVGEYLAYKAKFSRKLAPVKEHLLAEAASS